MGDVFGAASFVLTVDLGAVLLCSSVAISVEPKTFLLISLPCIVAIALIFVVSYDHALMQSGRIGDLHGETTWSLLTILMLFRGCASLSTRSSPCWHPTTRRPSGVFFLVANYLLKIVRPRR